MRFLEVSEYGEQQFYRLTGVRRKVFELMVEVVSAARGAQRARSSAHSERGRPTIADLVLLARVSQPVSCGQQFRGQRSDGVPHRQESRECLVEG